MALLKIHPIWFYLAVALCFSQRANACQPQVNLGGFIAFCQGNSITLNAGAGNPGATFLWSTGATSPSITVTTSGVFWVQASNPCGSTFDTVQIQVDQPLLNFSLGSDRVICDLGDTIFAPFIQGATYNWNGSGIAFGNKFFTSQSGTYSVSMTTACGQYNASINITAVGPNTINLGPDQVLCTVQNYQLSLPNNLGVYQWFEVGGGSINSNVDTSTVTINTSGKYYVNVTNACGTVSDTIDVWISEGAQLNLGGTSTICGSGSATLISNASRGSYLWSTGDTSKSISVSNIGTYWLRFSDICGTFYDTVKVISGAAAVVNLGNTATVCTNKGLILDAGNPGSTFIWSTQNTTQTISVNTAGTYFVGVDNGCGFVYDTITLTSVNPPDTNFLQDTVYACTSDSTLIDAGNWGTQSYYAWSTGQNSRSIYLGTEGNYSVSIGNECDTVTKNFYVKTIFPITLDLGKDTSYCGEEYSFDLGLDKYYNSFIWSDPAIKGPADTITKSGKYWVQVTNACGVYTDFFNLELIPDPEGFIPTVKRVCNFPGTALLSVPFDSSITYLWSTGDTSSSVTVNSPGLYWIYQYNKCDTLADTIEVIYDLPLDVDLGNDTTFCEPNIAYYNLSFMKADSILWSTGSRNAGLPISKSGTYWAQVYNSCGIFSDTVVVTVKKRPVSKLVNTAFCDGSSITLNVSQGNIPARYIWNTGDTTATINVNQQGYYYVDIYNDCATIRDSIFVRKDAVIPPFSLGKDTIFCAGTLLLDAGSLNGATYVWQNGSTAQTFLATQSGTYYVTKSNSCNAITDTINILITGPPSLILGTETRFCFGTTFTLHAQNPGSSYLWNTGETSQTIDIDSSGVFWVTITNPCGQLTDTVNVIVEYILNEIDLGQDTLICLGQTLRLTTQYPDVQHLWTGGVTDTFYDVVTTGIYWCRVSNSCGSWIDSIYVEVLGEPIFTLGADTVLCAIDDSIVLEGPPNMLSYSWNGGAGPSTKNFIVSQQGTYYLTVENECFFYTDTIFVEEEFPIDLNLGRDTSLCKNLGYTITPIPIQYPIKWDDGSVRPTRPVTSTGWYYASARNSCGIFTDSIFVELSPELNPPNFDTIVCLEDTAIIDLGNLTYSFVWEDGSTEQIRKFFNPDTVSLFITNQCGTYQKDFNIQKVNCDCPFFIPNAFTPNDDGLNDFFEIKHNCPIVSFKIQIFNRWGILVYSSTDLNSSWNGYGNGQILPLGAYNYQIEYRYKVYERIQVVYEKGSITLIR